MNRDRRAAEQAVIEAVAEWRRVFGQPNVDFEIRRARAEAVMSAYDALAAIPLELPGEARTNRGAPLTAYQAGTWMAGDAAKSAAGKIVRRMYMNRHHRGGYTVEELERSLGMKHQTCSARVHELARGGWLRTEGTRSTSSGRQAEVYYLTDHAIRLLDLNTHQEAADG